VPDPWYHDDRDKAAMARETERRRAAAWGAIVARHGDGVVRWSGRAWSRLEDLAERVQDWARALVTRRRPQVAESSTWPWRRWNGTNLLVADLTEDEAREMRSRSQDTERPRWLDRRTRPKTFWRS